MTTANQPTSDRETASSGQNLDIPHTLNLPRDTDKLLTPAKLVQLFPDLLKEKFEEWLQKCSTSRDRTYSGQSVRVSLARNYAEFQEEIAATETIRGPTI